MNLHPTFKSRLLVAAACLPLALAVIAACGKSQPNEPSDSDTDAGVLPPSDDAGTTVSSGNDGGSVNPPSACDVVNQTGCSGTTPRCGLNGSNWGCQAAGTGAVGDPCTFSPTGDSCQAGLICAAVNSATARCQKPCVPGTTSACPAEHACNLRLSWNGGSASGGETFNICAPTGQCQPELQNCAEADLGCFATNSGNQCLQPGTTADGVACTSANDCQKGSTCLNMGTGGLRCFRICSVSAASTDAGTPSDAGTTSDAGTGGVDLPCASGTCHMLLNDSFGACL